MMYAFPGETEEDIAASLSFIEDNADSIGSVCWSRCTVELDTALSESASIEPAAAAKDSDLAMGFVVDPVFGPDLLKRSEERMHVISALLVSRHGS
jgi:hypothetical protein